MVSSLLRKLEGCVLTENLEVDTYESEKASIKHRSPVIPDDFRCPISLELMKDPVIVSTGQTYERSCIQQWLDAAGHRTCPKTQQTLLHTALTPNYVLMSMIGLWCESNGVELPNSSGSSLSDCYRTAIKALLDKLMSNDIEQQRATAGKLRVCIVLRQEQYLFSWSCCLPQILELRSMLLQRFSIVPSTRVSKESNGCRSWNSCPADSISEGCRRWDGR